MRYIILTASMGERGWGGGGVCVRSQFKLTDWGNWKESSRATSVCKMSLVGSLLEGKLGGRDCINPAMQTVSRKVDFAECAIQSTTPVHWPELRLYQDTKCLHFLFKHLCSYLRAFCRLKTLKTSQCSPPAHEIAKGFSNEWSATLNSKPLSPFKLHCQFFC